MHSFGFDATKDFHSKSAMASNWCICRYVIWTIGQNSHSYFLSMVWDSYNAFNSLSACWIFSNFSCCSSGSRVLVSSALSNWIFMHKSSNVWLHLEMIPIQSLTSLNIFVHSTVCLCKVSLALFPFKTIFSIFSCSFLGWNSASFLLSRSCALRISTLSTNSDQSTLINSIYSKGSLVVLDSENWGTIFLTVIQASESFYLTFSTFIFS